MADLVLTLPKRFTAANRIIGIDSDVSRRFLEELSNDATKRAAFFECGSPETATDTTDGLRVTFDDDVMHLRPSGNAPEFRCYTEASSQSRAEELLNTHLEKLKGVLTA